MFFRSLDTCNRHYFRHFFKFYLGRFLSMTQSNRFSAISTTWLLMKFFIHMQLLKLYKLYVRNLMRQIVCNKLFIMTPFIESWIFWIQGSVGSRSKYKIRFEYFEHLGLSFLYWYCAQFILSLPIKTPSLIYHKTKICLIRLQMDLLRLNETNPRCNFCNAVLLTYPVVEKR